jgi:hypothetical protein
MAVRKGAEGACHAPPADAKQTLSGLLTLNILSSIDFAWKKQNQSWL